MKKRKDTFFYSRMEKTAITLQRTDGEVTPKSKHSRKPSEELREIIRLSKNASGGSNKPRPITQFARHEIPKSDVMKSDSLDSEDDNDDEYTNEDMGDDSDNDGDIDVGDDKEDLNNNADDDNHPSWPKPNFSPFGLDYEVRRKRSLGTKTLYK